MTFELKLRRVHDRETGMHPFCRNLENYSRKAHGKVYIYQI